MSQYDNQAIRELITAAFTADQIDTLAFDFSESVFNEFSVGMTTSQKIRDIVTYAAKHGRIPDLLTYIKRHNRYQFDQFESRLEQPAPNPPATPDFKAQRLTAVYQNIEREQNLLTKYEKQLRLENDSRAIERIEAEIERQKAAIAKYQQEAADLGG